MQTCLPSWDFLIFGWHYKLENMIFFWLERIPIRFFWHQQALTKEHYANESETCGLSSSSVKRGLS